MKLLDFIQEGAARKLVAGIYKSGYGSIDFAGKIAKRVPFEHQDTILSGEKSTKKDNDLLEQT